MNGILSNRRALAYVALALAAILLLSVNILARSLFPGARLDLTQDRLYTLSPGTKELLRSLDEPVTLRFYLSDRLVREAPAYGSYANRVRDMLEEYAGASNGKLRLEAYNPEPFSSVEDRAVAYGLQGVPIDQGGEQVYFGLVGVNTTDDEERIAFFQPDREPFLEYDLTRLVQQLSRPKQRSIGLITTLPIDGEPQPTSPQGAQGLMVMEQIRQQFQVKTLGTDLAEVPADLQALMIVHPVGLPPRTLYAIDQFVLKGGKALVMVDPHAETSAVRGQQMMMRGMPPMPTASDLDQLFAKWGVKLAPDVVVGDRRLARRVSAGTGSRMQGADYLPWISVPADNLSRTDPVTSQISTVTFASAGVLDQIEGAKTKFEPLIVSSATSMRLPVEKVKALQPDILGILRGFQSGGKPLTIAARVSGEIDTAFPDGPPKAEGEAAATPPAAPPAEQVKRGVVNAIIVTDTDFLEDRFWVQTQQFFGQRLAVPTASNADFVVNALDNLTGSSALISLRSRGVSDRPFVKVREIQQQAESQFREKEQALTEKLKETEAKLTELRGGDRSGADKDKPAGSGILTAEQTKAIEEGRGQLLEIRSELRDVQRSLREDIESLQATIRFVNVGLVPLLVAAFAVVLGLFRIARRRRATIAARSAA